MRNVYLYTCIHKNPCNKSKAYDALRQKKNEHESVIQCVINEVLEIRQIL